MVSCLPFRGLPRHRLGGRSGGASCGAPGSVWLRAVTGAKSRNAVWTSPQRSSIDQQRLATPLARCCRPHPAHREAAAPPGREALRCCQLRLRRGYSRFGDARPGRHQIGSGCFPVGGITRSKIYPLLGRVVDAAGDAQDVGSMRRGRPRRPARSRWTPARRSTSW